jgi:hypothetical protein
LGRGFFLGRRDFPSAKWGFFSQEGFCLGHLASWTREVGPGREASFGEDPWKRVRRPLSGTGRGGKGLGPTFFTLPFSRGLIGLSNADGFPKKEGRIPLSLGLFGLS